MKQFVNRPGTPKGEFNAAPLDANVKNYRTLQHYLQSLLKTHPHDIDMLVTCPPGEDEKDWIYSSFRQYLQELNYYAYAHRDVSTAATEPNMEFKVGDKPVTCLSAVYNPPRSVPAIDYITQTIDQATNVILDAKLFPSGVITPEGLSYIETFTRRLYRIFVFSFSCHRDIFDRIESETHICERFTRFAKLYNLFKQDDIHIPESYWKTKK